MMKIPKIGDIVLVKDFNITGTVIEVINESLYRVERKNQSFIIDKSKLSVVKKHKNYENIRVNELYDPLDDVYEIDFHGYTKFEALKEVAFIVENAKLHQYPVIRIMHGKGRGILRVAIHELLKAYKEQNLIKGYEYAQDNKGGYGVTIVHL